MERFRTPGLIALAVVLIGVGSWQLYRTRHPAGGGANANTAVTADTPATDAGDVQTDLGTDAVATVSLMVDYGDGRIQVYNDVATSDRTVVGALSVASRDPEKPFAVATSSAGVSQIGDRSDTDALRWQFWVNNEYVDDPGSFELADGDVLLAHYVKPQTDETLNP